MGYSRRQLTDGSHLFTLHQCPIHLPVFDHFIGHPLFQLRVQQLQLKLMLLQ